MYNNKEMSIKHQTVVIIGSFDPDYIYTCPFNFESISYDKEKGIFFLK